MLLEKLVAAVEAVQRKTEKFRSELEKSEALTRYVLVDPVLRALGWDTEDPDQVRPEFSTESGNPDYALLWEGKPFIMVEAKALGKDLSAAKEKGFQYCWKNKVPYYVVTDGNVWELHDLREMGGKQIMKVQLTQMAAGEVARELLALWRPAMPAVQPAPRAVLEPSPPSPPSPNKLSLSELERKMKAGAIPSGSPSPKRLIFPDGQEQELKNWRDLLVRVVAWKKDRLPAHVPIIWPGTGRVLVARDHSQMRDPKPVGEYWVETHASAQYIVKQTIRVLSVLGEDPSRLYVILR